SVSNYRIISYRCELCQKATVQTNRGAKGISAGELEAAACDAVIERRGERSRSTIPPSVRRAVMERDGYRCQAPGCTNTHFLEVHHRLPRANGGSNHPENLVTLCSRCHKLWHARGWGEEGLSFQAIPAN
ncbi:MAG: HNH endonuclease, partial [Candidatus Eisenbacteria sp.]|nr:HNH endonuclease [Candidatus Eisenbacteria bacterium]